MSDAFNSSPARVGDLLTTTSLTRERIVVPEFQRGYMWKKKHVEDFWKDVDRQRSLSRTKGADPHFFGPIVTLSKPAEGIILLLDGQQRLATTTILFSVLRDVARAISKATGTQAGSDFAANLQSQFICNEDSQYSIELGETDCIYFRNTIQLDPPTALKPRQLTHRNIKAAREILYEKVVATTGGITPQMDSIQAIQTLKEIKQTLISDLVTARIPVNSQEAAFEIFTTLNDRGLRLSPPDLLLSYLMEHARETERRDIRSIWTQMVQKMGTHDIHDYLRTMWISRYGDLKKDDLFTALKNHIEKNHINSLAFARECGDECDDYSYLATADESQLPKDAYKYVRALTRELGLRSALPLLLSAFLLLEPLDFADIAKFILVFVTRYSIIGNKESSGMEDLLFKLAREVRTMAVAGDKESSKKAKRHVKTTLSESAPDDDATERAAPGATLDASDARYVMMRLARYIEDPEKQVGPTEETNLEHIYPQSPSEGSWGGLENQEKLEPLTWTIGNLTIFGKRANRKAANNEFSDKAVKYRQSKLLITRQIAEKYTRWDEAAVAERGEQLAKLVVLVWNFDNPSRV